MNELAKIISARIAAQGPISLADYMADCLVHPVHGYYSTRDPFGAAGDFITAPEISQMFGELIGLWVAQSWIDQGRPPQFALAELGPGRGTLMADIWRATRGVDGFHAAARPYLVETSETLCNHQRGVLGALDATWIKRVDQLPDMPLFLVANEFFDALPIQQFLRHGDGWSERLIGFVDDQLQFGQGVARPIAALDHRLSDTKDGDLVEICPSYVGILGEISDRIIRRGGVALLIDYGDWRSLGDTLQALKSHAPSDPLVDPGQADLTAHVDFEALAMAAPELLHSRLTPQGVFLQRLGIDQRAEILAKSLSGDALSSHLAAHHRLTAQGEMGTLFKMMALYAPSQTLPAGFAP